MGKRNVAVLYGGPSGEHEISLLSGASVVGNLNQDLNNIVPVGIDKEGNWFINAYEEVFEDHQKPLKVKGKNAKPISPGIWGDTKIDVVFPAVHGPLCEDGVLQGVLTFQLDAFVGCGVLASAVAMDKDISRRLLKSAGLPTVHYQVLTKSAWARHRDKCEKNIRAQFNQAVYIKPCHLGSSVGIHRVSLSDPIESAVMDAFQYDEKVVIEQAVMHAREIELAVLENVEDETAPLVTYPGEIKVASRYAFYDYTAKYLDAEGASLHIPADLPNDVIATLQSLAGRAFTALDCQGMARVDFLWDEKANQLYLNELNTIPGFTKISMYPKLWAHAGLPYPDLLEKLIELAVARQKRWIAIKRTWNDVGQG